MKNDPTIDPKERKALFLERLLDVDGVYVPQFYDVSYHEDGTIKERHLLHEKAKPTIKKQLVVDLDTMPYASKPIVPYLQPVHDRIVLELFRGCSRGCRFCQAGFVYRPVREKSLDTLKEQASELLHRPVMMRYPYISFNSDYKSYLLM